MQDFAIDIAGLGKRYTLGGQSGAPYRTLRDTIMQGFRGGPAKTQNDFWALKDINLQINPGERVGIIGRNGAGKSTLLKLISRITHPTKGEIKLRGRVTSLLEVGTGFHPELTGRENIFLNGAVMGMQRAEIRRKFDEIVDFAGVEQFLDTPVKRYSSGMYTRLAFAVAAHLESEILIVDEVLAVGDAQFQKKCLGKMEEVGKKEGRTVLFVSHNMNVISNFCNRAVFLQQGRVLEDSTDVRSVTARYLASDTGAEQSLWEPTEQDKATLDNPYCAPRRFFIGDADGNPLPTSSLRNDEQGFVHIEFDVQEVDPGLTTGYALYADNGELLYWSYQTDRAENEWPQTQIGRNRWRSPLPMRLLNEDEYRLEWLSSLHFRSWLLEAGKTAPAIRLNIRDGLSDSPIWMNRRPGMLAPVLPWEVL